MTVKAHGKLRKRKVRSSDRQVHLPEPFTARTSTKMKTKTEPPSDAASVTTTAKLTIRGQTFDLSLEELEHIHGIIGEALGKKKAAPALDMEAYKKALEEANKHKIPPIPMWPPPHYVPPINLPDHRPYRGPNRPPEVWCTVGDDSRADAHIKLLRASYPEQFPNG
jgi:hypothetical protein